MSVACDACRVQGRAFAPGEDWTEAKRSLDAAAMSPLGLEDPCSPFLAFGYRCAACGQVWRLCAPDESDPGGCFEAG